METKERKKIETFLIVLQFQSEEKKKTMAAEIPFIDYKELASYNALEAESTSPLQSSEPHGQNSRGKGGNRGRRRGRGQSHSNWTSVHDR